MTTRGLYGSISPAARGAPIEIQQITGGNWRTLTQVQVGDGDRYWVRLRLAGRYRVVYRGLSGPAVSVR